MAPANGGRDVGAGLAAQPRQFADLDADAAHGAHFIEAGGDVHADAHCSNIRRCRCSRSLQALQVFQAFDQAFSSAAGQKQNAQVRPGVSSNGSRPQSQAPGGQG